MMDTQTYKAKLEVLLVNITEELKTVGIHNPDNPQDWIAVPEGVDANEADVDLVADVAEDWDERRGLVATLEVQYNNIQRALRKIEEGTYGACEVCGSEVEEDRLLVSPEARTDKAHMNDETTLPL